MYRVKQGTTWCHKLDHGLSHIMCYMICGDLTPQEDRGDLGSGAVASGDEALLGGIRSPGGVGHCMSVNYGIKGVVNVHVCARWVHRCLCTCMHACACKAHDVGLHAGVYMQVCA